MKRFKRIFLKFAQKKSGWAWHNLVKRGGACRWGLKLMGFPPPTSLLSGYQWPLSRPRHDFPPLKSEERHKHLLRPESKVDGVGGLLLPPLLSGINYQDPPCRRRHPPCFFKSHPTFQGGREALTLEAKVGRQGATLTWQTLIVGVQACPRYQYQIVRDADWYHE